MFLGRIKAGVCTISLLSSLHCRRSKCNAKNKYAAYTSFSASAAVYGDSTHQATKSMSSVIAQATCEAARQLNDTKDYMYSTCLCSFLVEQDALAMDSAEKRAKLLALVRDVYVRGASLTLMAVAYDLVTQEENAGGTDEDTLASLLVSAILEWVLQGFVAKNKQDLRKPKYLALREFIHRSTCDKESMIRVQAVSALARLVTSEDPSELQEGEKSILNVLLDVMAIDLPPRPAHRRDPPRPPRPCARPDPATHRAVYASVFTPQPNAQPNNAAAHSQLQLRTHTIAQRKALMRAGLGDR
ncbi:hypothetical protein B0H14DRAFT_2625800 [Mycena olivaceomarginata]|nr:hypothetical protein B0H14DRAFT_2625800 [Mycena olivaceomarginata]